MNPVTFIFAPGAGATSSHPWMEKWATQLGTIGEVHRFDYEYMIRGLKRPDPLGNLVKTHQAILGKIQASTKQPVVLIGKSMGSRIGCHVSLESKVAALVCLAYPLCAGGDPTKLRDQVLRKLKTPILFIQGTRDKLCPIELLESVRQEMSAPSEIVVVEGGDHSLLVSKGQLKAGGESQEKVDERILESIQAFLKRQL